MNKFDKVKSKKHLFELLKFTSNGKIKEELNTEFEIFENEVNEFKEQLKERFPNYTEKELLKIYNDIHKFDYLFSKPKFKHYLTMIEYEQLPKRSNCINSKTKWLRLKINKLFR
jgi:hypothetical protein